MADLKEKAAAIKTAWAKATAAGQESIVLARETGRLLAAAKPAVQGDKTTTWGLWVSADCGITPQYANALIRIHQQWEDKVKPALGTLTGIGQAIALLRKGGKKKPPTKDASKEAGQQQQPAPTRVIVSRATAEATLKRFKLKWGVEKMKEFLLALGIPASLDDEQQQPAATRTTTIEGGLPEIAPVDEYGRLLQGV